MLFSRDTQCNSLARMKISTNNMAEWVLVNFIVEDNHPLLKTSSKSRMYHSLSTIHRTNVACWLVCTLKCEGVGTSNIARVRNVAGD